MRSDLGLTCFITIEEIKFSDALLEYTVRFGEAAEVERFREKLERPAEQFRPS